ncbi:MAG: GDP-mannose 4,6-dehydratase [Desulfobacterales bacterium]|nr:GDP-mannose 4,6-dehydratase [Desulfobacterales bacterium]
MVAKAAGYDLRWEGREENEIGIDRISGRTLVRVNPKFYRPAEVDLLIGNPEKAMRELGWQPKTTLEQLCQMMLETDIRRNERGFSFCSF